MISRQSTKYILSNGGLYRYTTTYTQGNSEYYADFAIYNGKKWIDSELNEVSKDDIEISATGARSNISLRDEVSKLPKRKVKR